MTDIDRITENSFCCPELCSGDANVSSSFYESLFGWKPCPETMPEGGSYTAFKLEAATVACMYQMQPERKQAGVQPHWNLYIAVKDARTVTERAQALGGTVLTPPFEAGGSVMANLQDATDARFCIWQINENEPPVLTGEPGALCWGELYTRDTAKATAFYSGLFGWEAKPFVGGPMPYTTFNLPGQPHGFGGMIEISPMMQGWAPQWLPYFQVDDAAASAARIRELGGNVFCGPMAIPNVGQIVMLSDPQGAPLAVIQPAPTG